MKVELYTYKCGDNDSYWTFCISINGELVKTKPLIYRMYKYEATAIRNGRNHLHVALYKFTKQLKLNP